MASEIDKYRVYQEQAVLTASPGKLILFLYDRAISLLNQAQKALNNNEGEKAHNSLVGAQSILWELISSLDYKVEPLAQNLFLLYDYMLQRLVEANLKKDKEIIEEVKGMLVELKESWVVVVKETE